jgi:acylphosphatase
VNEVRHLIISGRVQGVGFRYALAAEAQALGVTGWVRNLASGHVEAVVAGTPEQVALIMNWARRGPPSACVEHVAVELGSGEFTSFELRASL